MQDLIITSNQLRAARALLGWKQSDLSRESKVSIQTIRRLELMDGVIHANVPTLSKIIKTLIDNGISFSGDLKQLFSISLQK